jgi:intron-binding protein aquarius
MGERDLDVDDDFSRAGRVNNMLARRLTLLAEVEKLSALLGVVGTEYTCETAGYFWLLHVLSRCVLADACIYRHGLYWDAAPVPLLAARCMQCSGVPPAVIV